MSNKIVNLTSDPAPDPTLLVYADISLDSIPAKTYFKQVYDTAKAKVLLSPDMQDQNDDNDDNDDNTNEFVRTDGADAGSIVLYDASSEYYMPSQSNIIFNNNNRKKANYKLEKNVNAVAVKRAIHNIFAWIPGQRILNPEFGSNLRQYLYEGITDYNTEQIMSEIKNCFLQWEPRAKVERVVNISSISDTEHNTVRIEIVYSIPSLSIEQFSYVYEYTVG